MRDHRPKCCIFLLFLFVTTTHEVRWTLETIPIMFGKNVTLLCLFPADFSAKYPRKWKIGTKLLIFNEGSIDTDKYVGKLEMNGFSITIMDFAVDDFRKNYTCIYGYMRYNSNLIMEKYLLTPKPGTYHVHSISTAGVIKVSIEFQKVHPQPDCTSFIGDKPIQANVTVSKDVIDTYFFAIKMTFEDQYKITDCRENVSVLCKIESNNDIEPIEIVSVPRHCADVCQRISLCLYNGTCEASKTFIECDCTDGFHGERCENIESAITQGLPTIVGDTVPDSKDTSTTVIVAVVVALGLLFLILAAIILKKFCKAENPSSGETSIKYSTNPTAHIDLTSKNSSDEDESEMMIQTMEHDSK